MCYEVETYKNEQGQNRAIVFSHGREMIRDVTPATAYKTVQGWMLVDEQKEAFKR